MQEPGACQCRSQPREKTEHKDYGAVSAAYRKTFEMLLPQLDGKTSSMAVAPTLQQEGPNMCNADSQHDDMHRAHEASASARHEDHLGQKENKFDFDFPINSFIKLLVLFAHSSCQTTNLILK